MGAGASPSGIFLREPASVAGASAVFAWVLLAEPFGVQQAVGSAVVLAGIVFCRLAMLRR